MTIENWKTWRVEFETMGGERFNIVVTTDGGSSCGSEEDEALAIALEDAYENGHLVRGDKDKDFGIIYDPVRIS